MDEKLRATLSDWVTVAAGFAVLGFQHAQVRRREVEKILRNRFSEATGEDTSTTAGPGV